jgi:hypothetical protein
MRTFLDFFSIGYAKRILYCLDSEFGLALGAISGLLMALSSNLQYLHHQHLHQRNRHANHEINT